MTDFNDYAKKADKIARDAFAELTAAENKLKDAEQQVKAYPERRGITDYEYAARSARAQADLMEAREQLHRVQIRMGDYARDIANVRAELAEGLNAEYAADPARIDTNTLMLLQSGILHSDEYSRMFHDAKAGGNLTMARLVSKYASIAAEEATKKYGESDRRAMELRAIGYQGDTENTDAVAAKLAEFDVLQEAFSRSVNNTPMISCWDSLVGDIVENF